MVICLERGADCLHNYTPAEATAKSFGLSFSLTLSGLDLGLIEIGLMASNIYSAHDIN